MIRPHRSHPLWFAFILHRLSGVVLALFLPLHFYVLSLALTDPVALNGFLSFSDL
ncbi:MAG: succinate dehydrogenase, partial [Pseudomonadota bacterium]